MLEKGDSTHVKFRSFQGVKAFFEAGYLWNIGDSESNNAVIPEDGYKPCKLSMSASAGCQFNNFIFVGMGVATDVYNSMGTTYVTAPIFIEGRLNILNARRITPFTDVRIGYSVGDMHGLYWAYQLGVRYALPKKRAVFLSCGCDFQINQDYRILKANHVNCNLGFKFGFEL